MLSTTIRQMLAHKLRLVLTTASIALGVAFLAGTLVLTDTMGLAFDAALRQGLRRHRRGRPRRGPLHRHRRRRHQPGPDPGLGARARSRTSTASAPPRARVTGYALLTDTKGKAVLTNGGAPTQGYSMPADEKLRGDVELMSGTAPDERPARSPSTPPAPRSTTSRSGRTSRCSSRGRPRSSPSSAPSASVARRTSAAPRRRTSTPRPRRRCSVRRVSSTRST